ncbi:MAG: hypothetical protein Q8M56_09375 [Desulfobacterales bacterium]|nr:hypothetical protein [Desulfobacterales bacterium]
MHTKKHLGFKALRKTISMRLRQIKDHRKGTVDYTLHDCFMSSFAMMFFQDPSLLQFQLRLEKRFNRNNLKTLFDITDIPKDSQLREVLDAADNDELYELFADLFRSLQRGKHLDLFRFMDDRYLMCLDGSGYFSSEKIHCPACLKKTSANGHVRYEHQILQPIIVCPGIREVIPLAPEPIANSDGTEKQDCEINAAKRLIGKLRQTHPKLKLIVTGDSLYSKQPFIDRLKAADMAFILVAKPADHKILFQEFTDQKGLNAVSTYSLIDDRGRRHLYEWINQIPLNGTKDADNVNFFQYSLFVNNKRTYHNSWVTDIEITKDNMIDLVKGGRARWKVENECFNTLKNQGYHIEHNFGHGQNNLSMTFFLLNLLAFFVHQILQLTDRLYQQCRKTFGSRIEFWNQLRCTIRVLIFADFEHLLAFIIDPPTRAP